MLKNFALQKAIICQKRTVLEWSNERRRATKVAQRQNEFKNEVGHTKGGF